MDIWRNFYGPNVAYVLELYDRYCQNPDAVDEATRAFFAQWTPAAEVAAPVAPPRGAGEPQVADALETMLQPHGVAVYLEAHHMCMAMRGVEEEAPLTRTTVWRGHFADDASLRSEFFTACGLERRHS